MVSSITFRPFMTYHWIVNKTSQWAPQVEQELPTLPEYLIPCPDFSWRIVFVDHSFSFSPCSFCHCSSICTFWLSLVVFSKIF